MWLLAIALLSQSQRGGSEQGPRWEGGGRTVAPFRTWAPCSPTDGSAGPYSDEEIEAEEVKRQKLPFSKACALSTTLHREV